MRFTVARAADSRSVDRSQSDGHRADDNRHGGGDGDPARDDARAAASLERLPYYGVFDYLTFGVDRGVVSLNGYAYNGSLRYAAEMAAKRTSGVDEVANRLEVLPSSQEDDRIRWATFYRIYTDAFLSRYASGGDMAARREIYEARRWGGLYQPLGLYRFTSSCVTDRRRSTAWSIATRTSRLRK